MNLPSDPNANTSVPNATVWGGTNGANWGDSCGRFGNYNVYLDPNTLGLTGVTNFGFGCNIYYVNKVEKKICAYWQANASGWMYGDITIPGFINQYEGGNSATFDALHTALYNSSACR